MSEPLFARCDCWWNPETGYLEACKEHEAQAIDEMIDRDICANCGKTYDEHLLWDGNKCAPGSINGWFPKRLADIFKSKMCQPRAAQPVGTAKESEKSPRLDVNHE